MLPSVSDFFILKLSVSDIPYCNTGVDGELFASELTRLVLHITVSLSRIKAGK